MLDSVLQKKRNLNIPKSIPDPYLSRQPGGLGIRKTAPLYWTIPGLMPLTGQGYPDKAPCYYVDEDKRLFTTIIRLAGGGVSESRNLF